MRENSHRNLTAQACVRFVMYTVALGQILTITTAALPVSFDLRSILILYHRRPTTVVSDGVVI
jgi:uncharacterized membrane protein